MFSPTTKIKSESKIKIQRIHILYSLLSLLMIYQTSVMMSNYLDFNYGILKIDIAMTGITIISLIVVGYFMLE